MGCKKSLFSIIFVLLLISVVSAEILISQPESVYNLGDSLEVELEVDNFVEGYFDVDLVCSEGTQENLFHGVLTAKVLQITRQLTPIYIGNLRGSCNIEASYGEKTKVGESFKISEEIDIDLELKEMSIKAGEEIIIKGKATKENGELVEGFINMELTNGTVISGLVKNGIFELEYTTKTNMVAGNYGIRVEVYSEDENELKLNSGLEIVTLKVKQEPAWIDIAIDKQIITPEQEVRIIPFLYDMANSEIFEELVLSIISESGVEFEKIIKGSEEFVYIIPSDHPVGYSKIIMVYENLSAEKIIDVQEYEKISIEIINSTVIVKNIGNIVYDGPIEITIGDKNIVKNVKIPLGGSKTYELSAPNGEYTLTVNGRKGVLHEGSVALTGKAISINEIGRRTGIFLQYPLVWIFILIVIGGIVYVMYMNNKKKKSFAQPIEIVNVKKPVKAQEEVKREVSPSEKTTRSVDHVIEEHKNIIRPGAVTKAEQVLVLNGQKQSVAILDIKIKNDLGKVGKETLNNTMKEVFDSKGVISQSGNDFVIIFSPMITRTTKNVEIAAKVAQKINTILQEHNGKFKERIEYGISVNGGEIINRKESDKLKFTNVGNTINLAKKVAEIADKEVLLSKPAHEQSRTNVKVVNSEKSTEALELFKVSRVIDTERNKEFIQNFMRKN